MQRKLFGAGIIMNNKEKVQKSAKKCNHRVKSENTTIMFLEGYKTFTTPEYVHGVCTCCGKSFLYIKTPEGELKLSNNREAKR